jgi:hypothetical protein
MCDYSLAQISNRLAVTGDHLSLHRFPSGSIGLRSCHRRLREFLFPSMVIAVCIPPGARILLQGIPAHLQHQLRVSSSEEVTFIQRGLEANVHRDGVRFTNGCEVLLQQLEVGQRATVLSLDCEDHVSGHPASRAYAQSRQ